MGRPPHGTYGTSAEFDFMGKRWVPFLAIYALGIGLVLHKAFEQWPWEDEFHSLSPNAVYRYRAYPASFVYLAAGRTLCDQFAFLRVWSSLPWILALPCVHALLVRLRFPRLEQGMTMALLACNSFLFHECSQIRYYGFFAFASVLALHGGLTLLNHPVSAGNLALGGAALILPAITIPSGGILSLAILACVLMHHRSRLREWIIPGALLACILLGAGAFHFRWLLVKLVTQGPQAVRGGFPIMTGYTKGPVTIDTFLWQYEKLLGLHTLEGWIPSELLATASLLLVFVAGWGLLRRKIPLQTALLASVILPVAVCFLAIGVINFINPRYYIHSSVILALGLGLALAPLLRSKRTAWIPYTILVIFLGALVRGVVEPQNPPLAPLVDALKKHRVAEIHVHPTWYAHHVRQQIQHVGGATEVSAREVYAGPLPEWIFVKDPRYVWRSDGLTPPANLSFEEGYELVERAQYLRKYYFHPPTLEDRLLKRR